MKHALAAVMCLAWLAAPTGIAKAQDSQPADQERILKYHSRITVDPNGWLTIREAIQVRAAGKQIKHGIFHDFPMSYVGPTGQAVAVPVEIVEVLRDGKKEPFHAEKRDGALRVYAGKADVLIPAGDCTYTFVHRTARQIRYLPDHDELYWNITGNGWSFPIDAVSAEIVLPKSVRTESIGCEAYTGPAEAKGTDYSSSVAGNIASVHTTKSLPSGEGLTVCVSWPKGHVADAAASARPAGRLDMVEVVLVVPATALAALPLLMLGL